MEPWARLGKLCARLGYASEYKYDPKFHGHLSSKALGYRKNPITKMPRSYGEDYQFPIDAERETAQERASRKLFNDPKRRGLTYPEDSDEYFCSTR